MKIAFVLPNLNISHSAEYQKTLKSDLMPDNGLSLNNAQDNSNKYFYPVNIFSFTGSQKTPLTDEDYKNAKKYFNERMEEVAPNGHFATLDMFNNDALNGIQKDIPVFEGLSMKDIAFILAKNPKILLNRGCNNCCAHCGYSATPITRKTYDRMSYEDFESLIDGLKELQNRMDSKVQLFSETGLFMDSDCINIEIEDKAGRVYDYTDCLKKMEELGNIERVCPLFDTSGWNPKSEKLQQRAEKFVDFALQYNPFDLDDINVSINPYHGLFWKAAELRRNGEGLKADELEERYMERIANTLFTFSPLVKADYSVNVLERALHEKDTNTGLDKKALYRILKGVSSKLRLMYENDLMNDKKYVQSEDDIEEFMNYYNGILRTFSEHTDVFPWGRAQELFINSGGQDERLFAINTLFCEHPQYMDKVINPNGEIALSLMDMSIKTDLGFNFENKDKPVKPFAHEIKDLVYRADEN